MKINVMGFSVPKNTDRKNEVNIYNTTCSYNNSNNNPFFNMSLTSDENYQGRVDLEGDVIWDSDINNYKVKKWFFKTRSDINIYAMDRNNYIYPFEFKRNYHVTINRYLERCKYDEKDQGVFIVTERRVGNPNFKDIGLRKYINTKVRNVFTGVSHYIDHGGNITHRTSETNNSFQSELATNHSMRQWKNLIEYYARNKQLLSSGQNNDYEALTNAHALYTAELPDSGFVENEKSHVEYNKLSENTLTFIEVEFIPFEKIKECFYLAEHDLFLVPEHQIKEEIYHPYSKEGMVKKEYKNTENDDGFNVTIYSQSHWLNNMCFYIDILGETIPVVPKKEDDVGRTNYIKVKTKKNGVTVFKEYELTTENLKILGISLNQDQSIIKEAKREELEIKKMRIEEAKLDLEEDKLETEEVKINYNLKELETKNQISQREAEIKRREQRSRDLELLLKYKELIQKAKYGESELNHKLKMKKLELKQKKKSDASARSIENIKLEIEKIKLQKEKINGVLSGIVSSIKGLETVQYFASKHFFNF